MKKASKIIFYLVVILLLILMIIGAKLPTLMVVLGVLSLFVGIKNLIELRYHFENKDESEKLKKFIEHKGIKRGTLYYIAFCIVSFMVIGVLLLTYGLL